MSDEPRRLLDDPELSSELLEDLSAARKGDDVAYDQAAGLSRLSAAITQLGPPAGGQGGSGGAGPSTPPGSAASAAGASKAFVWTATAAAVVAGAVGLVALGQDRTSKPVPVASAQAVTTAVAGARASAAPAASDSTPTLALSALPVESATPVAPKPSASMSPEERLRAEMQQLVEVRTAAQSDPARAVSLAAEGHSKFKGGVFYQEREALAISALLKLGRTGEAKTRAKAFLSAFPKGPYAERIRKETGLGAAAAAP